MGRNILILSYSLHPIIPQVRLSLQVKSGNVSALKGNTVETYGGVEEKLKPFLT
jgi:hypothetical protein